MGGFTSARREGWGYCGGNTTVSGGLPFAQHTKALSRVVLRCVVNACRFCPPPRLRTEVESGVWCGVEFCHGK